MFDEQVQHNINSPLNHTLTTNLGATQSGYLKFLLMKDIMELLGKSRSTINRWIQKGYFPAPIKIGGNSIAWPVEVIAEWREQQINQSNIVRG